MGTSRAVLPCGSCALSTARPIDPCPIFQAFDRQFLQDWSNTGLITANDNWSQRAQHRRLSRRRASTSATGVDPRTVTGDGDRAGRAVDVTANQTNPNTSTPAAWPSSQIANPTVALQGSGTADAPNLVFYLDATGRENVTFSFNARDIDGSARQRRAADRGPVSHRRERRRGSTFPRVYRRRHDRPGLATQMTAVS